MENFIEISNTLDLLSRKLILEENFYEKYLRYNLTN